MKRLIVLDQAKADIRSIDKERALNILKTLDRFASSEKGDVKRLQGIEPALYRLRADDYRVLFHDLGDSIEVTRVRHRREAYR